MLVTTPGAQPNLSDPNLESWDDRDFDNWDWDGNTPSGSVEYTPCVDDGCEGGHIREVRGLPKRAGYQSPPFLAFEAASFPREPIAGLPLTVAFRIENASQHAAGEVAVDLTLADPRGEHAPQELLAVGDLCTKVEDGHYSCGLGDMSPGDVVDVVFTTRTPMFGAVIWTANLTSAGDLGGAVELGGLLGAPAPPDIVEVVVLHDQTRVENQVAAYTYPYGPDTGMGSRHLMVVGHNLPHSPSDTFALRDSETIDYSFIAYPDSGNFAHQDWFSSGWARFYDMDDAAAARARAKADGYDFLLIRADLLPGILPGQHTVTLAGRQGEAQGHWGLEFGGLSARFSFIRTLPAGGYDLLQNAYVPERIQVGLETSIHLPIDEIPIVIDTDNLPPGRQGEVELIARRTELAGGRLYLTEPIDLHRNGQAASLDGGRPIAVEPERDAPGILLARIDEDFIFRTFRVPIDPPVASVAVGLTPAEGNYSWLWRDALRRAASCHPEVTVEDWSHLTQAQSHDIWNYIVFGMERISEPVAFGHHAAAILLRDMFVSVTQRQIDRLRWVRANAQAVRGLLNYMKLHVLDRSNPMSRMTATDFTGLETTYAYVALNDTAWLAEYFGATELEIEAWQLRETVAAVDRLVDASTEATQLAREAEDCDVEELIGLTGFSFEPIVRLLKPQLVTLNEIESRGERRLMWQPDEAARFWIDRVAPLAFAVREQQRRASTDTDLVLAAVALASAPFMLAESTNLVLLSFGVSLVDVGVTTVHELSQYFASEAELRFAAGAAITIGDERHKQALQNAKGWASTSFSIGSSALGAVSGAVDALPRLVMLGRVARGRHVARSMDGAWEIGSLRPVDLQDFGAFAMSSWIRRQAGAEALGAVERRALSLVEEYATLNMATRIVPEPDLPPTNLIESFRPKVPIRFDPDAATGLATVRPSPGGRLDAPGSAGATPNAREARVPEDAHVRFTDSAGELRELPLGERIAAGYTSEVFAHAQAPDDLVIRITYLRDRAPAAILDEFGYRELTSRVSSEHIRAARVEQSYDIPDGEFGGQVVSRVSVVERVPATAQETIARQGGRMTVAQMMAYEGALRDLNRQGLVWLDNKWDNFGFVPLNDGSGRIQVVVMDPGGIVAVRANAGAAAGETGPQTARRIQLQVNGDFETQFADFVRVQRRDFRSVLRRDLILEHHSAAFDYQRMGIPGPEELLFNARSGEDFHYVAPLFEAAEGP